MTLCQTCHASSPCCSKCAVLGTRCLLAVPPARIFNKKLPMVADKLGIDVWSARNGMLLCKPLERAFHNSQICFYEDDNGNLALRVLNSELRGKKVRRLPVLVNRSAALASQPSQLSQRSGRKTVRRRKGCTPLRGGVCQAMPPAVRGRYSTTTQLGQRSLMWPPQYGSPPATQDRQLQALRPLAFQDGVAGASGKLAFAAPSSILKAKASFSLETQSARLHKTRQHGPRMIALRGLRGRMWKAFV